MGDGKQLWRKEDTLALLQRLEDAMHYRRINKSELAEMMGVRQATVSQWFTLRRLPKTAEFMKLPKVLGGDANWWHGMEGGVPPERVPFQPIELGPDDIPRTD